LSSGSGERSAADLRALYQSVILDHNRAPSNRGRIAEETSRARGFNPLCGDDITVAVSVDDGRVIAVGFEGKGCAICTAASSCMTEVAVGLVVTQLVSLGERFEAVIRGRLPLSDLGGPGLLEAFAPVSGFPSRIKCAILPWRALSQALVGSHDVVTTEGL
jgi:nitrogen fixation NifU-like protein